MYAIDHILTHNRPDALIMYTLIPAVIAPGYGTRCWYTTRCKSPVRIWVSCYPTRSVSSVTHRRLVSPCTLVFSMSLLQIFFLISGCIISFTAYGIARRERFNAVHFLVFLWVGWGLLFFAFIPAAVDIVGKLFGIDRGADVLVYTSIIFLFYFSILLLRKTETNREQLTAVIREFALQNAQHAKK